jgi:DNA adenine methylase
MKGEFMLKSPFPYFGGKRRVAAEVWRRFGDVKNYVEPFCGSAAVLLGRPGPPRIETINDLDGYIANFWRATKHNPAQVAQWCDWPISEVDLHSRHRWLMTQDIRQKMLDDPHFYDPKIAGWWAWGQSMWIGSGWCRQANAKARPGLLATEGGVHRPAQKIPHVTRNRGVLALMQKRPHLVHGERGVHRQMPMLVKGGGSGVHRVKQQMPVMNRGSGVHRVCCDLYAYFEALAERLRRVRVCCGDWSRVCTHCVTDYQGLTAVFLDPPYGEKAGREKDLYATDSFKVAEEARRWAIEHGESDQFRIALCGYEGEHEMPGNWSVHAWKRAGGYGNKTNKGRERIWFSPHCLHGVGIPPNRTTTFLPSTGGVPVERATSGNPTPVQGEGVSGVRGVFGSEQKEGNDMAVKMTEKDLQKCGLMVDPQNPTQAVPIDGQAVPDETWDLERLALYAVTGIAEAGRLRTEAFQMARKSTVQIYRAGRALTIAQEKLKGERRWVRWLKDHNIPRTSAWEALELFRKAPTGGVVVWVVADQIIEGGESGTSARQRLYFQRLGFLVHQTIITTRKGVRCPGGTVRYPNSPEYAFVLSKGRPRSINLLRDRANRHAGKRASYYVRRKDGHVRPDRRSVVVPPRGLRTSVWEYAANGGTVATDSFASRHPAIMPETLAEDMILSWSRPGDLVFDCMAGAGTTLKMALLNDRRYLGMEVHEPYCDLTRRRLEDAHQEYRRRLDAFLTREGVARPAEPFQVIYADPPWPFTPWNSHPKGRNVEDKYPTMSVSEIAALPVGRVAAQDSVLFLWTTGPFLDVAIRVIEAWGFEYKTVGFIWVKTTADVGRLITGMGYHTRSGAEFCLLAKKRSGLPRQSKAVRQVCVAPVAGHSKKPEEVRHRIEELYGPARRLELFARITAPGWESVGNEIDGRDIRDALSGLGRIGPDRPAPSARC